MHKEKTNYSYTHIDQKIARLFILAPIVDNFLTDVILKFYFKNDIFVSDKIIDDLTKITLNENELKHEAVQNSSFQINFDTNSQTFSQKSTKIHFFKNKFGDAIVIEPNSLAINLKKYTSYKELIKIVNKVVPTFKENNDELTKLGLRYINQITSREGNTFVWDSYISPELTESAKFVTEDKQYLARNIGQMVFNKSDYTLVFAYGWFNRHFPNPIGEKEFILDYDCYSENISNLSEANSLIETLHNEIKGMFLKSIGDKLKEEISFV